MEARYKAILDNLLDGVYSTDLERTITYWNRAAERITGYSAQEVLGRHCHDNILVHVDGEGRSLCLGMCPMAHTMQDGQFRETLVYLKHKDGHRIPVVVRTVPLRDDGGNIIGGVEIFQDASESLTKEERLAILEGLAYVDQLTRVGNRRFLDDTLESILEDLKAHHWPFGVILFDIDRFKSVNDTYGHQWGDRVLQAVASTLSSSIRSFDAVARYGGEEFVVMLRNVDREKLKRDAERLRLLVSATWVTLGDREVNVTVSGGATMARPEDTPESLLDRADSLMYRSKEAGRNRITLG
ncbi:sensor domain-containing diguanylate cyclase [Thermanaerovibrio acidaminovorans]|jgi:diguanylate cyclase (GGDEF)-like protein/PAS domain S-box-containing protein|uniref:sensor domain-containing diguanylate cyclase n=1 Tax=Thermanaerovibrio acidaminovorans TaxID=81462 RepID=UPI0024917F2B|nr:sensor domain-containing diguanylate cyclase [Thermanaerovibrio acidaminovorans]